MKANPRNVTPKIGQLTRPACPDFQEKTMNSSLTAYLEVFRSATILKCSCYDTKHVYPILML